MMALAFPGCVHTPPAADRAAVSRQVEWRTGSAVGPELPPDKVMVPAGLDSGRRLGEDEVVLLALWNNPTFQELLVELRLTSADLVQAGLLPNPEVVYFFHVPAKPFKYAVELPLEAFWLRPVRLKNAERENARAAERLTQSALDLIRDTRSAYIDVLLARERARVAREAVRVRGRIADLAEARQKAGDASVQESAAARIDALQAAQDATRIEYEAPLAEERLRALLGYGGLAVPISLDDAAPADRPGVNVEELTAEAMASRPDVIAARYAVAAAAERLRLAEIGWVRFLGILDATSGTRTGREFGPAFRATLPVFNRNQGGIARARAEVEQLERRRAAVQNQVALEVRQAHLRYRQARAELDLIRDKVRPEVEASIARAEKAYKAGGAAYLFVLESTRQLIDTLNREAQLNADLRRAWAELERGVGRRLNPPAPTGPTP